MLLFDITMMAIPVNSSIRELAAGLADKRWTSVQLVDTYLERLETYRHYNAMIEIQKRDVLITEARRLDAEREGMDFSKVPILHGIPLIVKDNLCTKDMPTTAGAMVLKGASSGFDSDVVARLRADGAIIMGKANLTEFSHFVDADRTSGWSYLGGQTLNASSMANFPAGSSSGSAAAAVLRLAAGTVGTDTSGSIIFPADFQGAVGIRPTIGTCPTGGVIPISSTWDTVGPICMSVDDVAIMLDVMSGTAGSTAGSYLSNPDRLRLADARAGLTLVTFRLNTDSPTFFNIVKDFRIAGAGALRRLGTDVVEEDDVDPLLRDNPAFSQFYPDHEDFAVDLSALQRDMIFAWQCEAKVGMADLLGRFENIPSGARTTADIVKFNEDHPEGLHPLCSTQRAMIGARDSPALSSPEYTAALDRIRGMAKAVMDSLFDGLKLDVVCTAHICSSFSRLSQMATLAGCPIVTVPLGVHPPLWGEGGEHRISGQHISNLPGQCYGFNLIGRQGEDRRLLGYAYDLEQELKRPV